MAERSQNNQQKQRRRRRRQKTKFLFSSSSSFKLKSTAIYLIHRMESEFYSDVGIWPFFFSPICIAVFALLSKLQWKIEEFVCTQVFFVVKITIFFPSKFMCVRWKCIKSLTTQRRQWGRRRRFKLWKTVSNIYWLVADKMVQRCI